MDGDANGRMRDGVNDSVRDEPNGGVNDGGVNNGGGDDGGVNDGGE